MKWLWLSNDRNIDRSGLIVRSPVDSDRHGHVLHTCNANEPGKVNGMLGFLRKVGTSNISVYFCIDPRIQDWEFSKLVTMYGILGNCELLLWINTAWRSLGIVTIFVKMPDPQPLSPELSSELHFFFFHRVDWLTHCSSSFLFFLLCFVLVYSEVTS